MEYNVQALSMAVNFIYIQLNNQSQIEKLLMKIKTKAKLLTSIQNINLKLPLIYFIPYYGNESSFNDNANWISQPNTSESEAKETK